MELIQQIRLNDKWLKAAVLGSLWASVEVVAGSFLHNLQIPLSGTILTAFAIFLLSAFVKWWDARGVVWRAGLVCALMKSVSPSAVIFGPMLGILTEAFLFEGILWLTGRNYVGIAVAGAITALTAILHKLVALLIIYGFDFLRILDALYLFSVKQLHIPSSGSGDLVLLLTLLYLVIGWLAATAGFLAGKRHRPLLSPEVSPAEIRINRDSNLFTHADGQRYSAWLIIFHLLVMVSILGLLNFQVTLAAAIVAVGYLIFLRMRYPNALRRLARKAVWFQFLFLTASAIWMWDLSGLHHPGDESGWMMGLKMVFRAILLITGFSAISVELRNPLIRTVLYQRGMAGLYQSVSLAFAALPDLISSLTGSWKQKFRPSDLLRYLLTASDQLISLFEDEQRKRPPVFILTGEVGSGKSTLVAEWVSQLVVQGFRVEGFLSMGTETDGVRTGFQLTSIGTGQSVVLCSSTAHEGWEPVGRYYF
ncbi:MAG: hypothetical protein LWW85_12390, partial [Marinilabiliales bacterium]|nr:hypothetical protein [Marinilabiliales bacterium]